MSKIYYKIVRDNLTSISSWGKAQVTYRMNEFVKAPEWLRELGYHLLVFENIEFLKCFLGEIYIPECTIKACECYVKNVIEDIPKFRLLDKAGNIKNETYKIDWPWPIGTVMAEEVKLIKVLRRIEYETGNLRYVSEYNKL